MRGARFWLCGVVCFAVVPGAAGRGGGSSEILEGLQREAAALGEIVESELARGFLRAVDDLPRVEMRVVYFDPRTRDALSPEGLEAAGIEVDEEDGYRRMELGERFYYYTRYGTPLAYARALDVAAGHGLEGAEGLRVLDFGYGGIGHLRLLASLGADAAGVEVDPMLPAFYRAAGDVGEVARAGVAGAGKPGRITLHHGRFPADGDVTDAIGGGYDLFMSKNTLKRGYIHPEREVDPRMLVHLGVDDEAYVRAVHALLKPGGLVVIYNLYPAPAAADEPYRPWASGECPFDRELLERVGFEVVALDVDDTEAARAMGAALGWGTQMDFEKDLFGMYTVLRRGR